MSKRGPKDSGGGQGGCEKGEKAPKENKTKNKLVHLGRNSVE